MPAHHPAEFLRALLDASPFGVIALDPIGRVHLWNRAAERMFGWREQEVLGGPLPLAFQLQPQRECEVVVRPNRKDGAVIDVELRTAPWTDAEGNIQGTVAILAEITGRLTVERKLREMMEQEKAERRLRELLEA